MNDQAGTPGCAELIREIGRSEARLAILDTSEQHLMRLAEDPLSVREFLLREQPAGPGPGPIAPMPGEATLTLGHHILAKGCPERASSPARLMQYDKLQPLLETSLMPSIFEPSRDDRTGALDHDARRPGENTPKPKPARPAVVLLALFLGTLVLLVFLQY
jgi:hypothetical protein